MAVTKYRLNYSYNLFDRLTLKFVIVFGCCKIVNFGKCEGDSRPSFLNLLNSVLKTVLELILLSTLFHGIHVLGEIEIFVFRDIYHK